MPEESFTDNQEFWNEASETMPVAKSTANLGRRIMNVAPRLPKIRILHCEYAIASSTADGTGKAIVDGMKNNRNGPV